MAVECVVVKVGGSLYDWPALGARLRAFQATVPAPCTLLVPGGGATADAIRALDRTHRLGEEESHWLALAAMSVNARFLQCILPEARILAEDCRMVDACIGIIDPLAFFRADEERPDHLPHCWQVTSDSLSVRVAVRADARELILLKSIDWPGDDWRAASAAGVVDAYFADALKQAPGLRVRVVKLRA